VLETWRQIGSKECASALLHVASEVTEASESATSVTSVAQPSESLSALSDNLSLHLPVLRPQIPVTQTALVLAWLNY
jgi:hypothetical protein